jgi:glycosyltransferase involved in cell wall biosynthesis
VKRPVVLLLGPSREAISGVSTHLNALIGSRLASHFELVHFQVGSEGRDEGFFGKLARLALSPFALGAAIVRTDAELLHINTSLNAKAYWRDLAYLVVARLCGARVLCQVHGGLLEEFAPRGLFDVFVRGTLRLADAVVVLSRAQLAVFRARLPGDAVEVVPNGIDCAPYARQPRAAAERDAPLRLIYVGRLAPAKGLLETIEGLRLARSRGVAARLVLAGSGPEEPQLREYVRQAGLTRDVAFVGPAHGQQKAQLLAQADAFVLASYSEGLPYSLLEAMAAGCVPIVTPVGAIPDVVSEGEHGVFVPPRDAEAVADAIARLAKDRAMLARMSAACRARISAGYSLERVARDFSALYWGLCARRTPRPVI